MPIWSVWELQVCVTHTHTLSLSLLYPFFSFWIIPHFHIFCILSSSLSFLKFLWQRMWVCVCACEWMDTCVVLLINYFPPNFEQIIEELEECVFRKNATASSPSSLIQSHFLSGLCVCVWCRCLYIHIMVDYQFLSGHSLTMCGFSSRPLLLSLLLQSAQYLLTRVRVSSVWNAPLPALFIFVDALLSHIIFLYVRVFVNTLKKRITFAALFCFLLCAHVQTLVQIHILPSVTISFSSQKKIVPIISNTHTHIHSDTVTCTECT
jgi:hypothetical protein